MREFMDLIRESKSAPLYHGTDLLLLAKIVKENYLSKGINWGRPGEPDGPRLTRNYNTAMTFAMETEFTTGGVLVLDQLKISQRHRIQPYADVDAYGERWTNEFEEVPLVDELSPLSRYLVSINADPAAIRAVLADEDLMGFRCAEDENPMSETFATFAEVRTALTGLLNHPLLNAWVPHGRYTSLGWRSSLSEEETLTEGMSGIHGWWIDAAGEIHDTDHDDELHHSDIVDHLLDFHNDDSENDNFDDDASESSMDRAEAAIENAMELGWIRGSGFSKSLTIEWTTPSNLARRALVDWLTQYGGAFEHITIGANHRDYQTFMDARKAVAYTRQTIADDYIKAKAA